MGPKHPIKAMVHRFQFRCVKAIQHITRGIWPERGHCRRACSTYGRQQQRNQIRRALKEAIEPVVRFQGPPPDIASTATAQLRNSTSVLRLGGLRVSAELRRLSCEWSVASPYPGGRQPPLKQACPPSTSNAHPTPAAAPTAAPAAPGTASQPPPTKTAADRPPERQDHGWDHSRQPQDL